MEEEQQQKKKSYSSIPSNYVTLLQLQQRWLKQKNQQQQKIEDPQPLQERHVAVVTPTSDPNRSKNRDDSVNNRRVIGVGSDERRRSANGKIDMDGKTEESTEKKKNGWNWKGKEMKKSKKVEEEIGEKFRVLSVNSEDDGKQNWKNSRNGFRQNRFLRKNCEGRGYDGYGNLKDCESSKNKMIWVRKDNNGSGEIET